MAVQEKKGTKGKAKQQLSKDYNNNNNNKRQQKWYLLSFLSKFGTFSFRPVEKNNSFYYSTLQQID